MQLHVMALKLKSNLGYMYNIVRKIRMGYVKY